MRAPPMMTFRAYDPIYRRVFDRLAQQIRAAVGREVRVEHIGSTSVPGLGGRGVIDAVVVESGSAARAAVTSALLDDDFTAGRVAWIEPTLTGELIIDERPYPVLLYVLDPDDPVLCGWLACREHWRSNPAEAACYAEVKRRAVADGPVEPWAYQQAKAPYLAQLAAHLGTPPSPAR